MAWQSSTINPATTSPATDISKLLNDLNVLKGVIGGTADAAVPSTWTPQTSSTGSAALPSGTTAQRDASPQAGYLRYNSSLGKFEGYTTAWGNIGGSGGATGGGNDAAFTENDRYITSNYTLGSGGLTTATVSIASPAVVTQANTYVGGEEIFLQTTGALPTGLAVNTTYYVSSTGLSGSSFQISATRGGASINTSGTQSGTHSCGKAKSAMIVGPMTVAAGKAVTVPTGQRLVVL